MAMCSAESVAVMKPHLRDEGRERGGGGGGEESVVDLQLLNYN